MCPRNIVCITLLAVCHLRLGAQATEVLTNALPSPQSETSSAPQTANISASDALPDDPARNWCHWPSRSRRPKPERLWSGTAKRQEWAGDTLTLTGDVVVHYRDYVIRADSVVYDRKTTELEADGHLQLSGGPNDVLINASHGDMRLNMHTARFYNVKRLAGRAQDGTHGGVFDAESVAVLGPRAAADRRG
jgi:LPS-assembly protein